MKTCYKCRRTLEICNFGKNQSTEDGYQKWCRQCRSEYAIENKAKIQVYKQSHYIKNQDSIKDRMNKNYHENPEPKIEYARQYYAEHKDEHKESGKQWREKNMDTVRTAARNWKAANQPKVRASHRKRRALTRQLKESYGVQDEAYTKSLFNNQCANCGSGDNLCIDHHKPLSKGHTLTRDNAVILCNECNCRKGVKMPEDFYSPEKLQAIEQTLGILAEAITPVNT